MGKSSKCITREALLIVLGFMMPENKLIMEIALDNGIRIGDVLELRIGDVRQNKKIKIIERKTGKSKTIILSDKIRKKILSTRYVGQQDGYYVFPSRVCPKTEPRTRQAVNKDICRAIKKSGLNVHFSPHTARKIYAVEKFRELGDIDEVGKLLNHSYKTTTMIYAFADLL
jgi:integrase